MKDDTISRKELLSRTIYNPLHSPYITERDVLDCPPAQQDLSGYSDMLWKNAYERGKAEAQQWIPCSERLPTEEKDYIVSIDYGDEQHIGSDMFIIPKKGDPFWLVSDHVVAWMEGPEPYRQVTGKLNPDDRHCGAERDCIGGR